jgi:hypothetical protein
MVSVQPKKGGECHYVWWNVPFHHLLIMMPPSYAGAGREVWRQPRENKRKDSAGGRYPSWSCPGLGVCESNGAIDPSPCRCCRVRALLGRHGPRLDAHVFRSVPMALERGVLLTTLVGRGARHADVGELGKGPPPGTPTLSRKCTRGPCVACRLPHSSASTLASTWPLSR